MEVGKNQVEVEEEPVGREELELLGSGEVEVGVVEVEVVGLVLALAMGHDCSLFHSSAGTRTDHSGQSVEERRVEVDEHKKVEVAEDGDGQAEDGDVGGGDEELEQGGEQERGRGQGVDDAVGYGV